MPKNRIIELLEERPFAPLRLHMSNGRVHEIRHPESAIVGDYQLAMVAVRDGEHVIRLISLAHVNEVVQLPSQSA